MSTEDQFTLVDLAGSCPPAPVPDGVTSSEERAARWLHDHHRGYWGWADALDDARDLLAAIDGPEPDWADVRETARDAGWTRRTEPVGFRPVETDVWGHYPPGARFIDGEQGWVRVGLREYVLVVEFTGPPIRIAALDSTIHREVKLVDPTPAEALATARLVGLGGGDRG